MAIKYPGQQKIGYGKAQVFDTSKLAEGARYAAQVLDKKMFLIIYWRIGLII